MPPLHEESRGLDKMRTHSQELVMSRDVRKEIVGGNACEEKLDSHGSKVILLSHT